MRPIVTDPPAISPVYAGQVLTATMGTWTGATALAGQWMRGIVPIPGATGLTYTVTGSDVGARLAFRVTAIGPTGAARTVTSFMTAEVEPATDGGGDPGTPPPPPPPDGGGVATGLTSGVQTDPSPATLLLHAALQPADAITATVETYGTGAPPVVSWAHTATGEVILLNTTAGAGLRITAMAPAVLVEADRDLVGESTRDRGDGPRRPGDMHGAMVNFGGGTLPPLGPAVQGFDAGKPIAGAGSNRRVYSAAANLCPTKAGNPALAWLRGSGGASVTKARSIPGDVLRATGDGEDWRPLLRAAATLTVTDSTLATGRGRPFRPAPGAASKALTFYQNDVSLAAFPSLPPVAETPTVDSLVSQLQFWHECAYGGSAGAERYHPLLAGDPYRTRRAALYGEAALVLCLAIPEADKRRILDGLVQIGIDTAQSVLNGTRWNTQDGLGGIAAGSKLPILIAAIALGDSGLAAVASRTDFSSEDRQIVTVDAADVADWDYVDADLGMPEWQFNEIQNADMKSRRAQGHTPGGNNMKSYRPIFNVHLLAQTLACRLISGGQAMWNNQRVFDYADRVFVRSFYRDGSQPLNFNEFQVSSPSGDPVAWGLSASFNSNRPSPFQRNMHAAYRAEAGPIWNWS